MTRKPPLIGWYVVEVDVEFERDEPLFARFRGPFPTRDKAEREQEQQQEVWERALDEWDGENPYDFKGWNIVEKHISDFQIEQLDRMDEDRHETMTAAADAVAGAMLAKEGIGPFAQTNEQ